MDVNNIFARLCTEHRSISTKDQYVTLHKYLSRPSFSYYQLFSNPTHKTKTGLQVGSRLLIATHLNQSSYLGNQKQGTVNKYDLTLFIRLFKVSERSGYFQGLKSLPVMKTRQTL
jgi:hypothetical protein